MGFFIVLALLFIKIGGVSLLYLWVNPVRSFALDLLQLITLPISFLLR